MEYLYDGPEDAASTVVLAHGAGVGMFAPAMQSLAQGLGAAGLRVIRFEFPYMHKARTTGRRGGPDQPPVLIRTWHEAIAHAGSPSALVIAGRSMGGRVATVIADEAGVAGVVCFAYPFHPAGRAERTRVGHLGHMHTPTLILQGTRDPLGLPDEIASYDLSPSIAVHYVEDGDHSFRPRISSGRTLEQNVAEAVSAAAEFISKLS